MQVMVRWDALYRCGEALKGLEKQQLSLDRQLEEIQNSLRRNDGFQTVINRLQRYREGLAQQRWLMTQLAQAAERIGAVYQQTEQEAAGLMGSVPRAQRVLPGEGAAVSPMWLISPAFVPAGDGRDRRRGGCEPMNPEGSAWCAPVELWQAPQAGDEEGGFAVPVAPCPIEEEILGAGGGQNFPDEDFGVVMDQSWTAPNAGDSSADGSVADAFKALGGPNAGQGTWGYGDGL